MRGVMIFDTFKKTFFPYLHQTFNIIEVLKTEGSIEDDSKSVTEALKQPQYVKERLMKLEVFLKDKFSKNWVSVRKAFLDLDADHDGYVTVEDIIRYFGSDHDYSFQDVKKLMQSKDLSKAGRGLNYQDFSRWVGNAIHSVQGFYFRHDSVMNPVFEKTVAKAQKKGNFKEMVASCNNLLKILSGLIGQSEIVPMVLQKIREQWKTIKKSFHDISKEKSGFIEADELKFYLRHWGLSVTEQTFNHLVQELDWDKDGKISYSDFQKTVGAEIHPGEGLYFRQD